LDGSPAPIDEECRSILNQSFHYLGKGRQCFVFVSDDGRSVIKLLNYRRFSLPSILPRWIEKIRMLDEKRQRRFNQTMNSLQLANTYLRQETGMLYLHLEKGGFLPLLKLEDRAHRKHLVNLNEVAFVLQKKVTPIFEELTNRYQKGGIESLKEGVAEFFALIDRRCSLMIADDDRDVEINYGFYTERDSKIGIGQGGALDLSQTLSVPMQPNFDKLGEVGRLKVRGSPTQAEPILESRTVYDGHIVLLDPGRLYLDHSLNDPERLAREKAIASKRLKKWLLVHYPEFFE
jgi:hypothetical protein